MLDAEHRISPVFSFHGELNDFLSRARRGGGLAYPLARRASIKDVIEALGAPHTEVGAIHVDGRPADFSHILGNGEHVDVYPKPHGGGSLLRPALPWPPRFVLDTHLGTLARHLRLFGFDARYKNDYDDAQLARISAVQRRILLTRDRGLLKRGQVVFARFIRQDDPRDQLEDVFAHFGLRAVARPFLRCTRCNTLLQDIDKTTIEHRLEPKTRRYYECFRQCPGCGRLFWKGSHFERMSDLVSRFAL